MIDEGPALFEAIIHDISPENASILQHAYEFARHAHSGQIRKTGDAYILHPLSVAKNLWDCYHDASLTAAALLHDVVEDCDTVSMHDIYVMF